MPPRQRSAARPPSAAELDAAAHRLREILGRLRRRMNAERGPDDLSATEQEILGYLDRVGPVAQFELAEAQSVRPQSIGPLVLELANAGFVARDPDPNDRRKVILSLTVAGRQQLDVARLRRQVWLTEAMTSGLSPAQQRTLIKGIDLLAELLEN